MVALGYPLPRQYPVARRFGDTSIARLAGVNLGAHTGIDLGAPAMTPVLAAAAGTARTWWNYGGGRMVAIDHGGGVETRYAHLSADMVTNGQAVAAGEQIGIVGATGALVTGAHLHYEVLLNGRTVDPAPYLGGATATTVNDASRPRIVQGNADGTCPPGYIKDPSGPNRCVDREQVADAGDILGLVLPPLLEPALNIAVVAGGALLIWRGVMTMLKP